MQNENEPGYRDILEMLSPCPFDPAKIDVEGQIGASFLRCSTPAETAEIICGNVLPRLEVDDDADVDTYAFAAYEALMWAYAATLDHAPADLRQELSAACNAVLERVAALPAQMAVARAKLN